MNISNQKTFDEQQVLVCADNVTLEGGLVIPQSAAGIVLFAHGSGSSRHSSRNRFVAQRLQKAGLATLLFDLLTLQEEEVDALTRQHRFDIDLLTRRLVGATNWLCQQPQASQLAICYFGASTGAAAALRAAAELPDKVSAVVSRGGRPDLAMTELPRVQAPTLLIVGGFDTQVIELNRQAQAQLNVENSLDIVPGATHLFEEPGTLEQVADLAINWFVGHLHNAPNVGT
jgi:putative phosphoribosyl transferase